MANINNLTSKIISDAEEKKSEILATAKEEKSKIISKKLEEAKAAEADIIEKAKEEAIARKERIISSAELKARNEKLEVKQKLIEEIFELILEALKNVSTYDFKEFVREAILNNDISGKQKMILNEMGKKSIDEAFLSEINKELKSKATIILSEETRNFMGGFILEKDGIEINYTFEALVNSIRDDLSPEVARVLFS